MALHALARLLLLSLALVPAAGLVAQRKVELDKEVKVKEWGYQIRTIKGWNSMPSDQEDRFAVGRWKLGLEEFQKRGDYEAAQSGSLCELRIIRLQPKVETPSGTGKPESESANERPAGLPASFGKKLDPKNLEEWIEGNYDGASKRWTRTPLKGSKMPGELIEFGSGAEAITVGYFRRLGVEWAVVYTSFEENYRKTWRDIYVKSILTFEVTENVDPNVVAAAKKDLSKLEGEEKREALKAGIAGKPGWYAIDTKYYVFLSNCPNRQFVEKLSKDLELVREKVYLPNFKPRNDKIPLNPVRVFATQSEYHQYGGPGGSAGYFSPSKGELVLFAKFEDQSASSSQADCRSVMFHEGFHQYIHFAVGDVSPHSWFNEGHGDFFAGMSVAGGQIKNQLFDWRVKYLKDHINQKKDLIPLRSLLRYPQSEYYANAGLKYSQGWAFIYFMRTVSKDKKHQQALDTYFNYLADNVTAFREKKKEKDGDDTPKGEPVPGIPGLRVFDFEDAEKVEQILSEAVDKAFAGIDLEKLDKDLRAWVEKL